MNNLIISRATSTKLTNDLMNCDFQMIASIIVSECKKQEKDRKVRWELEFKDYLAHFSSKAFALI